MTTKRVQIAAPPRARVRRIAGIAATAALLLAWWATLGPPIVGGPASYIVIRGDSMLPKYGTGDLVIVHPAAGYAVGDVVAYRVPEGELGGGLLVIHRIVDGDPTTGFVMQGDNNPAPDPWLPLAGDIAGSAWLGIPGMGRVISFLHQPAALAALASALVVGWIVRRSPGFRPQPPDMSAPDMNLTTLGAERAQTTFDRA